MSAPSSADVERFQALIEERLGLSCADWQEERLPGLLRDRIGKSHARDAESYLLLLSGPEASTKELGALAEQLTVGETYFFREARQFEALAQVALPALLQRRHGALLRILSAGCSSGEEAYTVALVLQQYSDDVAPAPATILGVDMNPVVLKKARHGHYSAWSLRSTPSRIRDRWFLPSGQGFKLRPEIRSMVTFEQRNLLTDDPSFLGVGAGVLDIVFCRNVTIYFSPEATRKVVARLEEAIAPGGFLFLGHSETLRGISDEFELMHTHETFYYRRKETGRASWLDAGAGAGASGERARTPAAAQTIPGFDADAWVNAIQRSTERVEAFTKPREEAPQTPSVKAPASAAPEPRAQLQTALDLFRAERFEEAMDLLTRMRRAPSVDPDVELLTAVICSNKGLFSEAERICNAAIGAGVRGAPAHYLLGLCREHEGNRERAVEHHKSAVRLDPSFAMPHLHLGRLARRAGDVETARAEMRLAAELVARERPERILLFGGGFHRNALLELCRTELYACGEAL